MSLLGLASLDVIAAIWFVACWIGYSVFSEWNGHRTASLLSRMDFYRREWMSRIIQRVNRMAKQASHHSSNEPPAWPRLQEKIPIGACGRFTLPWPQWHGFCTL